MGLLFIPDSRVFAQTSFNRGLLASFNFNGNLQDTSGNGKHATATNGSYTIDRYGNENAAFLFNGLTTLTAPSLRIDSTGQLSYCLWVKANSLPNYYPYISSLMGTEHVANPVILRLGDAYLPNNQAQFVTTNGKRGLKLNEYYFIVATYDGATAKIYINGELDSQAPYSKPIGAINRFEIGHVSNGRKLNGAIDDVKVYCRALSVDEVKMLYSNKSISIDSLPGNNLIAQQELTLNWKTNTDSVKAVNIFFSTDKGTNWTTIASNISTNSFTWTVPSDTANEVSLRIIDISDSTKYDEISGLKIVKLFSNLKLHYLFSGNLNDTSGNALNATGYNNNFSSGFESDSALNFSNPGSYVQVPTMEFGGDLTISAWIYATDLSGDYSRIIDFSNGQNSDNIIISFNQNTGKITLMVFTPNGATNMSTNEVFPTHQWVHLTVTFSNNGEGAIYWDGKLVSKQMLLPTRKISRTQNYINKSAWSHDGYWLGKMDDLKIFDRVLAPYEIQKLAQTQLKFAGISSKKFYSNGILPIQWYKNKSSIAAVNLLRSKDNGTNWDSIASNLTDTFFNWQIPAEIIPNLSLKIEDATNKSIFDIIANIEILKDKLLAYYNFDQNVKDSSSNNYDMLPNATTYTLARNNRSNGAALFTNNASLQMPSFELGGELTVNAWIYTSDPKRNYQRIIDFSNGMSNNNIIFCFGGTTGKLYAEIFNNSSSNGKYIQTSEPLEANKWVFVTLTVQEDGKSRIYMDGEIKAEGYLMPINKVVRNSHFVGKSPWTGDALFEGKMDQLSIFNRSLNPHEVLNLMKKNDNPISFISEIKSICYEDSLILNWYYDSNNIDSLNIYYAENNQSWKLLKSNYDTSNLIWKIPFNQPTEIKIKVENAANHIEFAEFGPIQVNNKYYFNRVLYLPFNGNTKDSSFNQFELKSNKMGSFAQDQFKLNNKALTFDSLVIKLDTIIPDSYQTVCFWLNANADSNTNTNLFDFTNHWLRFMNDSLLHWNIGNQDDRLISNVKLADNRWHFIACKYTEDSSFLFVDGKLQDSSNIVPSKNNASLTLGGYIEADNGLYRLYQGKMDEFSIFNKALSFEELSELACTRPDTLNFLNDLILCSGKSTVLTATGNALSYEWNNGIENGKSFIPTKSDNYFVKALFENGCYKIDTVKLTVNPNPKVDLGRISACVGDSLIANIDDVDTVYWNTGESGNKIIPGASGKYKVTAIDDFGCSSSDSVFVYELPKVLAGNDTSLCMHSSITLTAKGATSYTWNKGIQNGISFEALKSEQYIVIGTDINGCKNSDSLTITVYSLPAVEAGKDLIICSGDPVVLSATGAISYSWNNNVINGVIFNPKLSAKYFVKGTDENGCTKIDSLLVTVFALPSVKAGKDTAICAGSGITLTAIGAVNYKWNNNISNGVAFNPSQSEKYIVIGVDENGCKNKDSITVVVNALPSIDAGNNVVICADQAVNFNATGALTYKWSNNIANGTAFFPVISSKYFVTGTDANNCSNTDSFSVTVNPRPIVFAGKDTTICQGQNVVLSATGATSYIWNQKISNDVSFAPLSTALYIVTGTDVNNCSNYDTLLITVNSLPTVQAGDDTSICKGSMYTFHATGAPVLNWNNDILNGTSFTPAQTATYIITGIDENSCINTDSVTVEVNATPIIEAGPDIVICYGQSAILNATGAENIVWNNDVINNKEFTPQSGGIYIATGTNKDGCKAEDTLTITLNTLPTINAGNDVIVCNGKSVTLTALSDASISWNNGIKNEVSFVPESKGIYIATATDTNGCIANDSVIVDVEICSSVEIGSKNNIKVYPSFTKGKVYINVPQEEIQEVWIFNQNGQNIQKLNHVNTIDFSSMTKGIYFLKIKTSTGMISKKVVRD